MKVVHEISVEMGIIIDLFKEKKFNPLRIFDLGANIGKYTIDFGRHFKDAKIFCFEPIPSTFKTLNENLKNSDALDRISTYNFGIMSNDKELKIGKPRGRSDKAENSGLFSVYASENNDYDVQTASFKSLSKFCKEKSVYPDFMKIDIEGCEFEVLESIKDEFLESIYAILVEVNYDPIFPNPDNVTELMLDKGFYSAYPSIDFDAGYSNKNPGVKRAYNRLWLRK
jgi:FkbM family methyltransferase